MKNKLLNIVLVILFLIVIKLFIAFMINESFIKNYDNKNYNVSLAKKLLIGNFLERYIAHYNYGNALYMEGNYEMATKEFEKALTSVSKKRVCDVRVNLALAKFELIDKSAPAKEIINSLEEIQKILLADNCASESESNSGESEDAQEVYDKTEEEKQKQEAEAQNGDGNEENETDETNEGDDNDGEGEEAQEKETIQNESSKLNDLQKIREKAQSERSHSSSSDAVTDYNTKVW